MQTAPTRTVWGTLGRLEGPALADPTLVRLAEPPRWQSPRHRDLRTCLHTVRDHRHGEGWHLRLPVGV